MARAAAVHVDAPGSLSYVSKGRPAAWRAAARRRGSRPAAGAISAVCADIQEGCARSMRPGLRVRLGLGRAGCLNESGWSTAAATAMITAPSTAANVSQRMDTAPGQGNGFACGLRDVGGGGAEQRHNETRECVVVSMTPVSAVMCCPQQSSSAEPCLAASKELRFERNRRRNRHGAMFHSQNPRRICL